MAAPHIAAVLTALRAVTPGSAALGGAVITERVHDLAAASRCYCTHPARLKSGPLCQAAPSPERVILWSL